jgi:hypothetical protein
VVKILRPLLRDPLMSGLKWGDPREPLIKGDSWGPSAGN